MAVIGCGTTMQRDGGTDAAPSDASLDGSFDAGRDAAADAGIDASIDVGTDVGISDGGSRDTEIFIDGSFVYDFDAGTDVGNPLGNNFKYIGVGGFNQYMDEKHFFWNNSNDRGFTDGKWYYGDACFHEFKTGSSKCVKTEMINNIRIPSRKYYTDYVYGWGDRLVFSMIPVPSGASDLYLLNINDYKLILIETNTKADYACHGLNDREMVYMRKNSTGNKYFKYTYSTGAIEPLQTNKCAFNPLGYNYLYKDQLLFADLDPESYLYNLLDDTTTVVSDLLDGLKSDMYYNYVAVMFEKYVERYDLASGKKENVLTSGWNPQICTPNIMLWVRFLEQGEDVVHCCPKQS